MDVVRTSDLRRLMEKQATPCISLYLPTNPIGIVGQQDEIRWKNLLQDAEQQLLERGTAKVTTRELLESLDELPSDGDFWNARQEGLAAFRSKTALSYYRLPVRFDPLVVVGERFHLKPLIGAAGGGQRFCVLTLSQHTVRLFRVCKYEIDQMEVPGLPTDMESTLDYEYAGGGSQVHSAMQGRVGKQAAVFHGQGGLADEHKADLRQFFQRVWTSLRPVMQEQPFPLMLAGVDYLLPIFRDVCDYRRLLDPELTGNLDYASPAEIHQRAWLRMEPVYRKQRTDFSDVYHHFEGTGQTSCQLDEIIPAAREGRVDTLMVDVHRTIWGKVNELDGTSEVHDRRQVDDEDLLDRAAVEALRTRATVYPVEASQLPGDKGLAAIYRY